MEWRLKVCLIKITSHSYFLGGQFLVGAQYIYFLCSGMIMERTCFHLTTSSWAQSDLVWCSYFVKLYVFSGHHHGQGVNAMPAFSWQLLELPFILSQKKSFILLWFYTYPGYTQHPIFLKCSQLIYVFILLCSFYCATFQLLSKRKWVRKLGRCTGYLHFCISIVSTI